MNTLARRIAALEQRRSEELPGDTDEPEWWALGADVSPIVLRIIADLGLDLDECAAWLRIAGDGLVEMTTDTQAILADADACRVASKLIARISGP